MKILKSSLSPDEFAANPQAAMNRFLSALDPRAPMTYFFVGSEAYVNELEKVLADWEGAVSACTTSGEIYDQKYSDGHLVGVSLSSENAAAQSFYLDLDCLDDQRTMDRLKEEIETFRLEHGRRHPARSFFATLLIDGLQGKEEVFVDAIYNILLDIPLVGGSAGDNMALTETLVYDGKKFSSNKASSTVVATSDPFRTFKTHDFYPLEERFVVTENNGREVTEIDGRGAVDVYAEALGLKPHELNKAVFADNPFMISLGGENYIRSIADIDIERQSLVFHCAIEKGMVIRMARNNSLSDQDSDDLRRELAAFKHPVAGALVFECIYRRSDIFRIEERKRQKLFQRYGELKVVGFHTYGEQYNNLHVNQTIVGVIFGE